MTDFRELIVYSGSKADKSKNANRDKGFKASVKSGEAAIRFESIYNTTKTTFRILESIRLGQVVVYSKGIS